MKKAIYTFDICPVYGEGRRGEHPEIEVSDELWQEYAATLDRLQVLLEEVRRLVYRQGADRRKENGC